MITKFINRKLYDAIDQFDEKESAQDYYYSIMDSDTEKKKKDGSSETVRELILRLYATLFCDDMDLAPGVMAGPDEVAETADRLYIGSVGYDSAHWYRMKHHFPVIDDDNYDRFAALVISDLRSGPLHDTVVNEGKMLIVGEADPLHMTAQQRKNQKTVSIEFPGGDE